MEDLVDLWKDLALTGDENKDVCVTDRCPLLTAKNVGHYAVGKWFSSGTVNVEAFKAVMKFVWGVH